MRTFILGSGAQKSGTTWLYRQLCRNDSFVRPAQKELHVLDALHLDAYRGFRESVERDLSELLLKGKEAYEGQFVTRKFQMLLDEGEYYRYFDDIMISGNSMSSDLTPSYAALPADVIDRVKSSFEARSISTRVIFLMREPVSRLESALRKRLKVQGIYNTVNREEMMTRLGQMQRSRRSNLRSSYKTTVNNIQRVFQANDVYLGFFETMFEAAEVKRLARFLSMDSNQFDPESPVHKTQIKFRYPRDFIESLRQLEAENYDFVSGELGFPLELWDAARERITL